VALGFSAVLANALPVPMLPATTGTYAVGVQYLNLVDENRDNSFFTGSTDNRELMVKIYYPAEDDATQPFIPYFRGSKVYAGAFLSENGFPSVFFEQLTYAQELYNVKVDDYFAWVANGDIFQTETRPYWLDCSYQRR